MYCKHCGARLGPEAAFCSVCGAQTGPIPVPANRKGSGAILAVVAVLVLAIAGGSGLWLLARNAQATNGQSGASEGPHSGATSSSASSSPTTTSPPPTPSPSTLTFPALYKQSSDGVVRVETTACDGGSVGTGFLIAPNLVATVAHVVADGASVVIRQGSTITTGTVIGMDPKNDLALVRAHTSLTGHVFALDHDEPQVGTDVAAIGYPLGGPESLTKGAVSGLGRTIHVEGNTLSGLIQTDAGINPGNSGGPLLDTSGTVVGVVDAKETDASGIAYAIPASTAITSLNHWRSDPDHVSTGSCQSPTAPDDADVTIKDHSDSPEGSDAMSTFSTYANAINSGDYPTAYEHLSPATRGRIGFDDFSNGNESSFIITFDIDTITTSGRNLQVRARFTSVQDSSMGPEGQACSEWAMTYVLVESGSSWLIDHATPDAGSPTAC